MYIQSLQFSLSFPGKYECNFKWKTKTANASPTEKNTTDHHVHCECCQAPASTNSPSLPWVTNLSPNPALGPLVLLWGFLDGPQVSVVLLSPALPLFHLLLPLEEPISGSSPCLRTLLPPPGPAYLLWGRALADGGIVYPAVTLGSSSLGEKPRYRFSLTNTASLWKLQ